VAQLRCSACGGTVSATEVVCHTCGEILVGEGATVTTDQPVASEPEQPAPAEPAEAPAPGTHPCPRCHHPVDASATICPSCMGSLSATAAAAPYATRREESTGRLLLRIGSGDVTVPRGQTMPLGRDAGRSPVARTLEPYDNVSRLHATVGMDADGSAWIRDERSTNGTYVDGRRLRPGEATPLTAGSAVRLAADVPIEVRVLDEGSTG
jgi:hypothetical protein